ncbi:TRAP transporter small permease [Xanthobacter dioxanivorans]|uniref:TRAP transporter small permease protein n=2 Tax=Xanthobacter dioxanivorans TaxID=2528964 RepID=A0A974PU75_9HYPH|nr:TRAP transporter small permease [Xanthobacter dioxanivorans]
MLRHVVRLLSHVALWISGAGLVAMTAAVFWQVIGRYILNASPSWTEPLSLLLMSWFILLGAAVGVREGMHLGFEIGLHFASPPVRRAMEITTHVLVMAFGGAMAWYGWDLAMGTWSAKMAGIDLPQGVDYLPLVGGGFLICLFSFERLLTDLTEKRVPEVPLGHVHTVE